MSAPNFNARNPSVKRILQEMKEFQRDDSPDILAEALEDNIFEWHFVVRGAADTEFEGGIYHGRILLPSEYPFKPPSFLMLTPNGRFETGVKVCLSISSHHPEHWQPSWSLRTALVALIAFMQTPGNGAIGSLDYSKDERKDMARMSRAQPPNFGNPDRQALTNAAHQRMLKREAEAASAQAAQPVSDAADVSAEPAAVHSQTPALAAASAPAISAAAPQGLQPAGAGPKPESVPRLQPAAELRQRPAAAGMAAASVSGQPHVPALGGAGHAASTPFSAPDQVGQAAHPMAPAVQAPAPSWEETGLTLLAVGIVAAIAALLIRKVIVGFGGFAATSHSSFM